MANTTTETISEIADFRPLLNPILKSSGVIPKLRKAIVPFRKTVALLESCNNGAAKIAMKSARAKFIKSGSKGDLDEIQSVAREDIRRKKRSVCERAWNQWNDSICAPMRELLEIASHTSREYCEKLRIREKNEASAVGISFTPSATLKGCEEASIRIHRWMKDTVPHPGKFSSPPSPEGVLGVFLLDADLA